MNILLTGATGFIGRHVDKALVTAGHEVIRLARSGADLNFDLCRLSPDSIPPVDSIVHLAGLADAGDSNIPPSQFMSTNVMGTVRVLEVARRHRCRTVIASSMRVYKSSARRLAEDRSPTEPGHAYGLSKLTAELWARMYSETYRLPVSATRFFSVYGPGQLPRASGSGVVAIFAHRALAGQDLVVYHRQTRDFIHVEDAVRAVLTALGREQDGWRPYNVATGVSTDIAALAQLVVQAANSKSTIDMSLAKRPGESYVADVTRAEEELGFAARIGLRNGIQSYLESLKEEPAR